MCIGIKANRNLIGNLMIYITQQCGNVYLTKMLKLLYLIDEEAVRRIGRPITWLEYEVWEHGPVAPAVWFSKDDCYNRFYDYVKFQATSSNTYKIQAIDQFDDSDFSQIDLDIIDDVLSKYGKLSAKQLVQITHAPDSLWRKVVSEKGIVFNENCHSSSETIPFINLIKDDGYMLTSYYSALESITLQTTL